jgi:uncharacterized alkaline shock family protein YloU
MEVETGPAHAPAARRADTIHAPTPPRRGRIEVSPQAITTIAGRAVTECYGVVGIAARRPRFGALELVPPEQYRRGIEVRFVQDHVAIEVYVVLEYGLRISEIARNLIKDVKYAVEQALGLRVVEVSVNVQGLRVSARA